MSKRHPNKDLKRGKVQTMRVDLRGEGSGSGNSKCKGPEVGACLAVEQQGGKHGWSEEGERGEGGG